MLRGFLRCLIRLLGLSGRTRWSNEFLQQLNPHIEVHVDGERYAFHTGNGRLHWRARTFATEEPLIFEWIKRFKPGDVVLDIGANAGLYSVAFAKRGALVYACELDPLNAAEIRRNAHLNGVTDRVIVLPVACGSQDGVQEVFFRDLSPGDALQSMGRPSPLNTRLGKEPYTAPTLVLSLDQFWGRTNLPAPKHIKIDVDGNEKEVAGGILGLCSTASTIYIEDTGEVDTAMFNEQLHALGFSERAAMAISVGTAPSSTGQRGSNRILERH
jgi:FkbM family methyltransferase